MTAVAVLGPGGVGGFIAAALARAGEDVVVVAREETAATIERDGIQVTSVRLGDFTAHPATATGLTTAPDLLVVATKATTLDEALSRVSAPPRLVVPLLNGLDHIAHLREVLDPGTVAAGAIRIESHRPEPAVIVQTSPFLRVDLAADQDPPRSELGSVATLFERAGIPVEIGPSEAQILWSKLVRLNALALTTSAADRPIGFIRSDPQWREALIGCITEATAVANADGADMEAGDRIGELDAAHAELRSSMQRDIAAGRMPELDAIAGAVLRAGARHGLECPTIAALAVTIAERAGIDRPVAAS